MIRSILITAVAALMVLSPGCNKSEGVDLTYIISPRVKYNSNYTEVPAQPGVTAHLFYADTSQYRPASFAEARSGRISQKGVSGGITQEAVFSAEQDPEELTVTIGPVGSMRDVMIVVCLSDSMYAYRQATVAEGLPNLYLPVSFQVYRPDSLFTENKWVFVKYNVPEGH